MRRPRLSLLPGPAAVENALPKPTRRRQLILVAAVLTLLVELAFDVGALPGVRIGTLSLSTAVIPALALAIACGNRLVGRSSGRSRALIYWSAAAVALAALLFAYVRDGSAGMWLSLVVAALGEELVYRLAIPMVAAALLRWCNVRASVARPLGFVIGAAWFVSLPGHTDQMSNARDLVPFLAFAALSAMVVYRSGSVLPMAVAHAITNLLTVLLWASATSADQRSLSLVVVLGLLVVAYGERRRITIGDDGELVDVETGLDVATIDLRDGRPVTVTLTDGTVLEMRNHEHLTGADVRTAVRELASDPSGR